VHFIDKDGSKKTGLSGSYGIGITRMIGTLVEIYGDEKGLNWPKLVAPYQVHLLALNNQDEGVAKAADKVYESLLAKTSKFCMMTEFEASTGAKFNDADLIGIPVRLVVSPKTQNQIEWKERASEQAEILDLAQVIKSLRLRKDRKL